MFHKHPEFIVREREPFNGGPPPQHIRRSFVTSLEHFFVRGHAPVPQIDPASYRLQIGGLVRRPLSLSFDELRSRFTARTSMATLQCAGNRRDQFFKIADVRGEVPWGTEAISNADWEGVRLADLLATADLSESAHHVEFVGIDQCQRQGRTFGFGGSIPVEKAMDGSVLLVWQMNGKPLTPLHGFPLRALVPGYIGARSVKWLAQINLRDTPSENYFQAHAYRLFPPQATAQTVDWNSGLMLGELSINSAITSPLDGANVPAGDITMEGWAMAGGNRAVARVDLSIDAGKSWICANLETDNHSYSWRFWRARASLSPGRHTLICRAFDSAANSQPEDPAKLWNFKGYMNNAWHRVEVKAE